MELSINVDTCNCAGTNIYLLNYFLTLDQCESLISEIKKIPDPQTIVNSGELSGMIWSFIEPKISRVEFDDVIRNKKFKVIGITTHVTVSKNYFPVGRHIDEPYEGVFFKMGFYLNDLSRSAGTIFYENGEKKVEVESKAGIGFLFDISLEHESAKIPYGEMKYMVGVRPKIKYL